MTLKITLEPIDDSPPFINVGSNIKVTDIESGIDISECVRNVTIKAFMDDWVTATLECDIGKLELIGVDVEKVFPVEIRENLNKTKVIYKDGKNVKRKIVEI